MSIAEDAVDFLKAHRDELIVRFADPRAYPPMDDPFTIFMAGSPGAGKTEFSEGLVKSLARRKPSIQCVRIDADEIKKMLPQYTGSNSNEVQGASALGVQKLYDYCLKERQNILLDGTFADDKYCIEDVARSIKRKRKIGIIYIYQEPEVAWKFTQIREKEEGRYLPKEAFIEAFFAARENANRVKEMFKKDVELFLIEKDWSNKSVKKTRFNIDNIDNHIVCPYTKDQLRKSL
ncbi:MAG: zeta toxin family protein [Patescibacteria group bacterium]